MKKTLTLIIALVISFNLFAQNPVIIIYDTANTNWQFTGGGAFEDASSTPSSDDKCNVYVGSRGMGLLHFDGIVWTQYLRPDIVNGDYIHVCFADSKGNLWLGYGGKVGVTRVSADLTNSEHFNSMSTGGGLPFEDVVAITEAPNGDMWFATPIGMSRYDGSTWVSYDTLNSAIAGQHCRAVAADPNGPNVYVGTLSKGLNVWDGSSWSNYETNNSNISKNNITSVLVDEDGGVWSGGNTQGLDYLDTNGTWTLYSQLTTAPNGLPGDYIRSMDIDRNGVLWASTLGAGVASYNGSTWNTYTMVVGGLPTNDNVGLRSDHNGNIWITSNQGVGVFNPTNINFCAALTLDHICFGETAGTITASPMFGNGTYTYLWSTNPAQNTQTAGNLAAGSYTVTVTDTDSGWTAISTGEILEGTAQLTASISIIDTPIGGGFNGSLIVGASGGLSPYTYLWSNGKKDGQVNNLKADSYYVTITDAMGCTAEDSLGLWQVGINEAGEAAVSFGISPNPFNENTKISLELSQSGAVSINLFDISGRNIKAVLNQKNLSKGNHRISLPMDDMGQGIYILRLQTETGIETRKLVKF